MPEDWILKNGCLTMKSKIPDVIQSSDAPQFLLINPPVYDFAMFDLFLKPLGLLKIARILTDMGNKVFFLDCLAKQDTMTDAIPGIKPVKPRRFGTAKFYQQQIEKPHALKSIQRQYYRFGIAGQSIEKKLAEIKKNCPDAVLLTSHMTYWYPGLVEIVRIVRKVFGNAIPIVLGGIYASLIPEHARKILDIDLILTGQVSRQRLINEFAKKNIPINYEKFQEEFINPYFELLEPLDNVILELSKGCSSHCTYCASHILSGRYHLNNYEHIFEQIQHYYSKSIVDYAFYDDALLLNKKNGIIPLLTKIIKNKYFLRFHTPNGMHINYIDQTLAQLMWENHFKNLRFGLETVSEKLQLEYGKFIEMKMLKEKILILRKAGFKQNEIGFYVLTGLPGQDSEEVRNTILTVKSLGARPIVTEYSPIPFTKLWPKAVKTAAFDIENEPLFHNNTVLACRNPRLTFDDLQDLKDLTRLEG